MHYNETHSNFSKGNTMTTETTITTATSASKKAASAVVEASPVVTEVVDAILENPTRIAATVQWSIVGASVAAGVGLGAAGLWGFNKFRTARAIKKINKVADETLLGGTVGE
jgi:hypothetical protein